MNLTDMTIGFIGLGAMGRPMARNMLAAGQSLVVFDIDPDRTAALVDAGAAAGGSSADVCSRTDVLMASLRSSAIFAEVAEGELLPNARDGQVFVDLGTTSTIETRRLAREFAAKGAALVDSPVSGGPGGAERGALRMFVGGDTDAAERVMPILHVLGDPERVVYCGPSGCGQVVKYVNQLAMGLGAAAYLEAISLAAWAGIDANAVAQAVGGDESWRKHFGSLAKRVAKGKAEETWVKFPEMPLFLAEAREQRHLLPMTQALYDFLAAGDVTYLDNMKRKTASLWRELMERRSHEAHD